MKSRQIVANVRNLMSIILSKYSKTNVYFEYFLQMIQLFRKIWTEK
jgi:hypothetical protein